MVIFDGRKRNFLRRIVFGGTVEFVRQKTRYFPIFPIYVMELRIALIYSWLKNNYYLFKDDANRTTKL